jgi:hypothetical protein
MRTTPLAFNCRGTGVRRRLLDQGWLADIRPTTEFLDTRDDMQGVWLVGIAEGERWPCRPRPTAGADARRSRHHSRARVGSGSAKLEFARVGMVRTPGFPASVARGAAGHGSRRIGRGPDRPRPLFVLIGTSDGLVSRGRAPARRRPGKAGSVCWSAARATSCVTIRARLHRCLAGSIARWSSARELE